MATPEERIKLLEDALADCLNNRFSDADATAAEAARDTGEFIGTNGRTAYNYGYACLETGLGPPQAAGTNPEAPPGVSQTAAAVAGCAVTVGLAYRQPAK